MKKINSIMALLLTAIFTFTMTSCGDDDDDNDPENTKVEVSDLKDTGSALTFTISASAQGQSLKGTYTFGYDAEGNITSHVEDYTCSPSAMLASFKEQFETKKDIKVLRQDGNKLHIEYDEASLEGMTKDIVRDFVYPQFKKGIYEQFKLLLTAVFTFTMTSCGDDDDDENEDIVTTVTLEVSDEPCNYTTNFGYDGPNPLPGMSIREEGSEWKSYSQTGIIGFTYKPGTWYLLKVKKTILANPPMDASNITYELIEILEEKQKQVEVSDLKDTGSALTFTISASAQGQSVKGTYVFGYDLRGNITSHVEDYTCSPSAMADSFKAQFEDDPNIKVLTQNGNKLHIEYDEASLEGMTKDVVKDFVYPQIKKGIYEQFK